MYRYSYNNFILKKNEVEQIIKCLSLVNGDSMSPDERRKYRQTLNATARYIKKLKQIHDEKVYFKSTGKAYSISEPET